MGFFTDRQDRIDQLVGLVADGASFSQIARIMGAPSRNVVLAKFHRMHRANPELKYPGGGEPSKPREPKVEAPEPEPAPIIQSDVIVTYLTVTNSMCRFPVGDPLSPDFHVCGHPKKTGSAYCEPHHKVCYIPFQPRKVKIEHAGKKRA